MLVVELLKKKNNIHVVWGLVALLVCWIPTSNLFIFHLKMKSYSKYIDKVYEGEKDRIQTQLNGKLRDYHQAKCLVGSIPISNHCYYAPKLQYPFFIHELLFFYQVKNGKMRWGVSNSKQQSSQRVRVLWPTV